MIILEGPDGAGKTTLKEELLKHYPSMREGPRGTKDRSKLYTVTVADTFGAINRAIRAHAQAKCNVKANGEGPEMCIWDRLFFSEMIYAGIVGRSCEFSPGQQEFIVKILEAINCPIILCMPPLPVVQENAQVHEQMAGVNENLQTIYEGYEMLFRRMPVQTVVYDYTMPEHYSLDDIFALIDKYVEERSKRTWSPK